METPEPTPKVKANQHESYWTFTILAILIPGIAWIPGIILMTKDNKLDRKLGEHVLALSILFMILYIITWVVLAGLQTANAPVYQPY